MSDFAERKAAIERVYREFVEQLQALRRKHDAELRALLVDLEQRKIAEIRKLLE